MRDVGLAPGAAATLSVQHDPGMEKACIVVVPTIDVVKSIENLDYTEGKRRHLRLMAHWANIRQGRAFLTRCRRICGEME